MNSFAVVFDMDGVIIDSNPYHKISLRQFCEKYGYHFSDEELIKRIYGRTNNEWITNLFGAMPKEKLLQLGEEKEALFRALYKDAIKPVAGLPDFLEKLSHQQVPCAIGTSAPRSNVDFVLDRTLLRKYFSAILDQAHVTEGKPNPEIYLKTAQALNLPASQTIVIEDSLSGIEAAQRAGARVVGITTTHTPAELKHCDLVIADFTQLEVADLAVLLA
ncbi:MAG: HAD family phosphatase [Cyclobacteriaceae bacterium]|nr:HAD family phosphatase [Cytophagales bacterium]MBX2899623.1 HAD family phosphatase [Cyclobacteriaceae bacterium]